MGAVTPALAVEELSVAFDGFRAVDRLTFAVEAGEAFGIVGESGSGKSSVLRAICGLAPVVGGRILLDGAPVPTPRRKPFHARVQMVFQDPYGSLHPRHTVDRHLAEALAIHRIGDAEARILRALDEVGLGEGFRFRYPHQLSGGQRQRVAIARALILEPMVLLLDEPTSALDASVQAEVLNLLDDVRRRRGLTYVLVSHDLAVVTHMCRRMVVMDEGAAVEALTSSDLAAGRVSSPVARELITASQGFRRPG